MISGAGQGAAACVGDIIGGVASLASPTQAASALASVAVPTLTMPTLAMPTAASVVAGAQQAASVAVPLLTPMADLAAAAFISVPQYDLELFADGMQQLFTGDPMGLINAIGHPIAATAGL
ncbi:MAG: hypothetical protein QOF15_4572, partial [Mycobacterium sp.]|nr:hypothetical protein [Mycobacterium sp.]